MTTSTTAATLAALAATLAWAASALAGTDVGPDLPDVRSGPPFPRIANCYGARLGPWTRPAMLDVLARFDLLIGGVNWDGTDEQQAKLAANVAYLRKTNPHIIIIDFSSSAPYAREDQRKAGFPEGGLLRTIEGDPIEGWPGTLMINLSKPEVIEWLAQRSQRAAASPMLDGTFIDCMGGGFDYWACEIATGKPYSIDLDGDGQAERRDLLNRRWVQAKRRLARAVREKIGPKAVFMANQAERGNFEQLNGILLEDYLDYVLDDGRSWDSVLQDYFHWTATPQRPCVTTIVSSSGLAPKFNPWKSMSESERDAICARGKALTQRMRFGLATTLMGDGYFAYDLHTRWRGQHWLYDEYDAPLGYPKGPSRRQADGTWRREFDGGNVIVNPTPFDLPVSAEADLLDVSSGKVGRRFVVPSQDGRIFLPAADRKPTPGKLADPEPLFTPDGPPAVVTRGDKVLWRLGGGQAAVFAADGRLMELFDGRQAVVRGVRTVIVSGPDWKDFDYADAKVEQADGGSLVFRARRSQQGQAIDRVLTVAWADGALRLAYDYSAATDLSLHAFRHQAGLPAGVFAGGKADADGNSVELPGQEPRGGGLLKDARQVIVTSADGKAAVTLAGPGGLGLQDERIYNSDAFLATQHGRTGGIPAGTKWRVELTIRP